MRPEGVTKLKKILVVVALGAAGLFALLGGEYTTFDLVRMKDQLGEEQETIARLKVEVDSLETVARAVERDPRTQERLARDQFGMIKEGEHLYRIVPAGDSATR